MVNVAGLVTTAKKSALKEQVDQKVTRPQHRGPCLYI